MVPSRWTIRNLLLVTVAGASALLLAATAWFTYRDLQEQRAAGERQVFERARLVATSLAEVVANVHTVLRSMAQTDAVRRKDAAACQDLFVRVLPLYAHCTNVGLALPDGSLLADARYDLGPAPNTADQPWFRRALQSGELVVSDPIPGQVSRRPGIIFALATRGDAAAIDGVVGLVLDAGSLQSVLRSVEVVGHPEYKVRSRTGYVAGE